MKLRLALIIVLCTTIIVPLTLLIVNRIFMTTQKTIYINEKYDYQLMYPYEKHLAEISENEIELQDIFRLTVSIKNPIDTCGQPECIIVNNNLTIGSLKFIELLKLPVSNHSSTNTLLITIDSPFYYIFLVKGNLEDSPQKKKEVYDTLKDLQLF